jgi:transcriptional regulator with XRE-family HTH domain
LVDNERRSFAAVLNDLCTQPVDGRRRHTNVELAETIRSHGGEITHTYISQLRKGHKDNPTCRTIEDLADALDVHPAVFVGGRRDRNKGHRPRWRRGALKTLFELVHPPGRGPFSPEEVATAIATTGRYGRISPTYIRELLSGASDNPRLKHILGLASHFGAEPAYFFDDDLAARVNEQLQAYQVMDQLGVNTVIMRAAEMTPTPAVRNKILLALARALHPGGVTEDAIREALHEHRATDGPDSGRPNRASTDDPDQ